MIGVSNDFKTAMKQPVKELRAFLDAGDLVLWGNGVDGNGLDDLISIKVSCESGLCKSAMRKLEAQYVGDHNLVGKWVSAGFGVKLASGTFEYLRYGSFLVSEQTVAMDTGITSIVAYDKMVNAMTAYQPLEIAYPIDLRTYTQALCSACGLELGNAYFGNNLLRNVTEYLWRDNANGYAEAGGDYIKVVMPETPTQYSGVYATAVKDSLTGIQGKKVTFSFYAKADANRTIMFQSAGEEGYHYINLTTEWQRFHYVVDNFTYTSPTFYCGNTLDKTPYYIKDIMVEETGVLTEYKYFNQMNDWMVESDLWLNIDGITYRDIFVQIAQATASTCLIGNDDKVYFKPLTATGEQLTYSNMLKLKLEPVYGEINSVALTRTPVDGEDVRMVDEDSVAANEMTEFCIDNNQIIDKARELAIEHLFYALKGIKYYPFETATEGLGWYEIGDYFGIVNDAGDVMPAALFNFSITLDGGIKETLKATAETKTQSQHQYATPLAKRVMNTEIVVNKQEGTIQALVGDVNDRFSKIYQDIDGITQSVQTSGGNNLIKNSVMFAYDNSGKPLEWDMSTGGGGITMQSDPEALTNGGISGHSFTLHNQAVRQDVRVKVSTETAPVCYSFSARIKKDASGSCYVRIFNDTEDHYIPLGNGETAYYKEFTLTDLYPRQDRYTVEIYADAQEATFTDCMLNEGEHKKQWSQAIGEVMNTQVNVSVDGVLVRSSVYQGDYTVMSPLEFAGYSKVGGSVTKVFSLNKDVTYVKKLDAEDEMRMVPIKVVPVLEGDLQGWAFVPST